LPHERLPLAVAHHHIFVVQVEVNRRQVVLAEGSSRTNNDSTVSRPLKTEPARLFEHSITIIELELPFNCHYHAITIPLPFHYHSITITSIQLSSFNCHSSDSIVVRGDAPALSAVACCASLLHARTAHPCSHCQLRPLPSSGGARGGLSQ
jgi:hypothetical protein